MKSISNFNNGPASPKIACILDAFSYTCFKHETRLVPLNADNWEQTMIDEKPDLLFCESSWSQSFDRLFRFKFQKVNSSPHLLEWCRKHHIPTVFWNKEDPLYFNHFLEAAKGFDYIFTTDSGSIPRYKAVTGHDRVYLLPFAAQIAIHNPINRDIDKFGKVAFAGTWYKRLPDRGREMEILLKPALKHGLHIYDRMNKTASVYYKFPELYQPYIKGSLPYEEMVSAYKKYDIFLNVNTVKDSPTMLARRVFELLACGTNIISNDSLAVRQMFPGIVQLSKSEEETAECLNRLTGDRSLRDKLSLLGQRAVFQEHTYTHRLDQICQRVGLKYKHEEIPCVSIIAVITNPGRISHVIENFRRQKHPHKELIIIFNDKVVESLISAIHHGIRGAKYEYISFFNEDCCYGSDFIGDLVHAHQYSKAEIVGKSSFYVYFKGLKGLFMRFPDREYRYETSVEWSAMMVRKDIFDKVQLTGGKQQPDGSCSSIFIDFMNKCRQKGYSVYSADRFNFVSVETITQDAFNSLLSDSSWALIDRTEDYQAHTMV